MRYCAGCKRTFEPLLCFDSIFVCAECKRHGKTKEEVEKLFNEQLAKMEARR